MDIVTPSTDDSKYPLWHHQPQRKTPSPDMPRPYATPKEMGAAGCDAMINKELGSEDVYDPLQSRNASPTPGPRTPPMRTARTLLPYHPSVYQLREVLETLVLEASPVAWPHL